jgi:hypothetical protein
VVLTGNLPSVEYSTDVLLLTMPLPVIVLLVLLPKLSYSLHRSKERSYDFNASGDSLLITVTINQSNIDNYGNVGTIQISTTGNNKIFSEVTEKTYSNDMLIQ